MTHTYLTWRRLKSGWRQSMCVVTPVSQASQAFLQQWPTQTDRESDHLVSCDQYLLEPEPGPLRDPHSDR